MDPRRIAVCSLLLFCGRAFSASGSVFSASFAEYAPGEAVNDARWPRALLEREGRLNCVAFVAYDQNGAMVARQLLPLPHGSRFWNTSLHPIRCFNVIRNASWECFSNGASYLHSCRIALPIPP